jgi:hypothetical protein|nr:MAG TPA: hypothetical protein [Caudoviricetes sp.]
MSVINTETDRKGKTVTYATGIVDFVKLDKFAEPKTFVWDGKAIVSTHRASLAIKAKDAKPEDKGVWIGLGDIEIKEGFDDLRVKNGDDWVTIEKGVEVSIDIDKVDQKGDKTYYNTKKSRITVISTEGVKAAAPKAAKASESAPVKTPYKKRDTVGIETGHAVNGALELIRGGVDGDAFELAGVVQSATVTLKAEVAKERGVDVTDYDLGASVGHAILNACRDHSRSDVTVDELIEAARSVLALSDRVADAIRGNSSQEPVKQVVTKPKKATPVKEEKVTKPTEEPPVDFDDDVPF